MWPWNTLSIFVYIGLCNISSYCGINKATILYLEPTNRNRDTEISTMPEGIEFEHSATE